MRTNFLKYSLLFASAIAIMFFSCKKDNESTTKPTADFSETSNGLSVTFTNTSLNTVTATTYLWNFGDSTTSVEASPTHVYSKYGTYNVMLKVMNSATVADSTTQPITISKVSAIKLDDNSLSDWANVPDVYTNSDPANLIQEAKIDYDKDYIYFYIVSNTVNDSICSLSFNLDNDTTTGYISWYIKGKHQAADLYSEGVYFVPDDIFAVRTYINSADNTAWNWQDITGGNTGFTKVGYMSTSGNSRSYEFAVPKSKLSITASVAGTKTMSLGDKVGIIFMQYVAWNPSGGFVYTLDLTK